MPFHGINISSTRLVTFNPHLKTKLIPIVWRLRGRTFQASCYENELAIVKKRKDQCVQSVMGKGAKAKRWLWRWGAVRQVRGLDFNVSAIKSQCRIWGNCKQLWFFCVCVILNALNIALSYIWKRFCNLLTKSHAWAKIKQALKLYNRILWLCNVFNRVEELCISPSQWHKQRGHCIWNEVLVSQGFLVFH